MENELYSFLVTHGILIGSQQWGGSHSKSDHDFVLPLYKRAEMLRIVNAYKYNLVEKPGSSQNTCHTMFNLINEKVWAGDRKINILTYEDSDIPRILELNRMMDFLRTQPVGEAMIADKRVRIHIVEDLLNVLFWEPRQTEDDEIPF